MAVERSDKLMGALAGLLIYEIAAERAGEVGVGPGSFVPTLIDKLHSMVYDRDGTWLSAAKVSRFDG